MRVCYITLAEKKRPKSEDASLSWGLHAKERDIDYEHETDTVYNVILQKLHTKKDPQYPKAFI